ncbi:MAG: efflux RND transporter periplasmic adaptor subunit [Planctomycetaceae bacterium]|nr:efflux RND transporter periplasmic adaptor subunit [Planctomycetaceae bacterium]
MRRKKLLCGGLRLHVGGLVTAAVLAAAGCSPRQAPSPPPAVPVSVATVMVADTPVQVHTIGTVTAYSSVVVRSQIAGPIVEVHVVEGSLVDKGQLLFGVDPRPAQASLAQAQAALAKDSGQLEFAKRELQRTVLMNQKGAATLDEVDTAKTAVRTLTDSTKVDQAAVESAKLQLAYCYIYAPIEGVAGEVTIKTGNVVAIHDTALLTLNQIHPIYVTFTLAQRHLDEIRRYQHSSGALPLQAYMADRTQPPSLGALTFINNTVDPATGTILLKGTFANTDNRLWPGQFVDVALTLTVQPGAVLVPSRAVQAGQNGTFVFVIDSRLKARMQPVEVDRTQDDQSIIAKGLSGGETVVVDGQLRLVDGLTVRILPEVMPQGAASRPGASSRAASSAAASSLPAPAGGGEK